MPGEVCGDVVRVIGIRWDSEGCDQTWGSDGVSGRVCGKCRARSDSVSGDIIECRTLRTLMLLSDEQLMWTCCLTTV